MRQQKRKQRALDKRLQQSIDRIEARLLNEGRKVYRSRDTVQLETGIFLLYETGFPGDRSTLIAVCVDPADPEMLNRFISFETSHKKELRVRRFGTERTDPGKFYIFGFDGEDLVFQPKEWTFSSMCREVLKKTSQDIEKTRLGKKIEEVESGKKKGRESGT